jgi:acetyl esterase/lipase
MQPNFSTPEKLRKFIEADRAKTEYRPPASAKAKLNITETKSNGFTVYTVTPKSIDGQPPAATAMYLHGGSFVVEMTEMHWKFVTDMAMRLGARVVVPIYPLGPEHHLPEMYEMLQPLYDDLAAAQTPQMPFWVMGDSAGGTLAITLTQLALDAGKPAAARVVPITPSCDVTLTNPQMHVVAAQRDYFLALPGLTEALNLFLGGVARNDPIISATYGRLDGLPPMLLFVATDDLLGPDAELFAEKIKAKGCDVTLSMGEGLMHVWPILTLPESMTARNQMVEWLKGTRKACVESGHI